MLQVNNLTFKYRDEREYVFLNFNFESSIDGICVLVGASGIGKTTFMDILSGIHTAGDPDIEEFNGIILIEGKCPRELKGPKIISWVPQTPLLLDHLNVIENVLLQSRLCPEISINIEKGDELLSYLGLSGYRNSHPRELSGGMKTRVCLARALVSDPKYLFLDEPFSSLDINARTKIYEVLKRERLKPSLITFMTTHNIPEAVILGNQIFLLNRSLETKNINVIKIKNDSPGFGDVIKLMKWARKNAIPIEKRIFINE